MDSSGLCTFHVLMSINGKPTSAHKSATFLPNILYPSFWAEIAALQLIADEFDKVFFYFPNGLQDRTVFQPVDARERIVDFIPEYTAYFLNRLQMWDDGRILYERVKVINGSLYKYCKKLLYSTSWSRMSTKFFVGP